MGPWSLGPRSSGPGSSVYSHPSKWTTWTVPKSMHISKIHSLSTGGAHSRLLVHIASPTSPPLCRYTTHSSVPHTAPVEMPFLLHCSTNGKLPILVKAQPAPQAPGHCHQLGLAYGRETWVYPMNTLPDTVAYLLLPDTNLLPQVAITHYSLLLT